MPEDTTSTRSGLSASARMRILLAVVLLAILALLLIFNVLPPAVFSGGAMRIIGPVAVLAIAIAVAVVLFKR